MALKEKVKTALNETRLLILGSQILFGFQLNGMFQDAFEQISAVGRGLNAGGYFLMATTVGLLIAPSMQHRLVERGQDTERMHRATNRFAALALIPFAPSLGITFYIVLERHVGAAGAHAVHVAALALVAFAVILLMTPAAIHRITFGGEDTERFHTLGGRFVVAAAVPLGLGISLELYVALVRATQSPALAIAGACAIAALFAGLWFVQPLMLRRCGR